MGINSQDILHDALKNEFAPNAFLEAKTKPKLSHNTIHQVSITQLLHQISHGEKQEFTMNELQNFFLKKIVDYTKVTDDGLSIYLLIMCMDKGKYVNPRKKRTQERRKKASTIDPYPPGSLLDINQGIYDTVTNTWSDVILPRRLAISGHMRQTIGLFIHEQVLLKAQPKCNVVFDFDVKGPYQYTFQRGEDDQDDFYNWSINQGDIKNTIGEDDLQFIFYTKYCLQHFTDKDILINQTDTDMIPLFLNLALENSQLITSTTNTIRWFKYNHSPKSIKGHDHIDFIQMYKSFIAYKGKFEDMYLIPQFILLCILDETDYVDKDVFSHRFGWRDILTAVQLSWQSLLLSLNTNAGENGEVWELYRRYLFQIKIGKGLKIPIARQDPSKRLKRISTIASTQQEEEEKIYSSQPILISYEEGLASIKDKYYFPSYHIDPTLWKEPIIDIVENWNYWKTSNIK